MKIAIVDDEKYWRESVVQTVKQQYCKDNIELDLYKNGIDYLRSREKYDITFIDIEMPELDGFDTINRARKYNGEGIYIILTTHTEMSRKGYMVNAFRYIDKTRLEEELIEAVSSANILLGRNEKVKVNVVGEGQQELILKNIYYIETEKHCILIHTKHGVIRCSNNLRDIEKLLSDKWFYRCHNSYVVNLDEIRTVKDNIIYMNNGSDIDVSKRKLYEFRKAYLKRKYDCANA